MSDRNLGEGDLGRVAQDLEARLVRYFDPPLGVDLVGERPQELVDFVLHASPEDSTILHLDRLVLSDGPVGMVDLPETLDPGDPFGAAMHLALKRRCEATQVLRELCRLNLRQTGRGSGRAHVDLPVVRIMRRGSAANRVIVQNEICNQFLQRLNRFGNHRELAVSIIEAPFNGNHFIWRNI